MTYRITVALGSDAHIDRVDVQRVPASNRTSDELKNALIDAYIAAATKTENPQRTVLAHEPKPPLVDKAALATFGDSRFYPRSTRTSGTKKGASTADNRQPTYRMGRSSKGCVEASHGAPWGTLVIDSGWLQTTTRERLSRALTEAIVDSYEQENDS